ncbi:MAG: PucR family transcriptional regulator ligand-binding domain-containing protein [Actinomycetaceae bacterium]|nr:PucR family transcriptional regulator ligand-binding domain-containing protein [Actinomycetaceae bacterium]
MTDHVTVKDVLDAPEFVDAKLLGGAAGLTNRVRSVAVAEIPDISMWLSGQEFVHTTGRFFANDHGGVDEEQFGEWVHGIIAAGSSCLAVKTHRFIGEIPKSIIELGEEHKFPIIELGETATQEMVYGAVYRLLTETKLKGIEKQQSILASFIYEMAEAHCTHFGVNRISEHVEAPVLLFDDKYNLIGASTTVSEKECRMLDIPRRVKLLGEDLTIPTDIAVDPNVCRRMQPLYGESRRGNADRLLVRPITSSERILGYCAILERTRLTAEQISLFVALADVLVTDLSDRFRAKMAATRARQELFSAILADRPDKKLIAHRAVLTGLHTSQEMRIVLLSVHGVAPNRSDLGQVEIAEWADQAVFQAMREILGSDRAFLQSTWERGVAILLFGKESVDRAKHIMSRLVSNLKETHSIDSVCGIGTVANGIEEVVESAQKSSETLKIVEAFGLGPVEAYETLGHYLMLASFLDNPSKAQDYIQFMFGSLFEKEESYPGLLETLEAYLAEGGSYTAAARELHMHVNTMRYRVEKINQLLPIHIDSLDGRGAAWLALRMYQYLQQ